MNFLGIPVYFDRHLVETKQYRYPRSKKRRIRKKWAKRSENYKSVPRKVFLQVGNAYFIHPDYFDEFCRKAGIEVLEDGSLYPKAIMQSMESRISDKFNREIYEATPISQKVEQPKIDFTVFKEVMTKFGLNKNMDVFPSYIPLEFEFPKIDDMQYQAKLIFEKYCTQTYKFSPILFRV